MSDELRKTKGVEMKDSVEEGERMKKILLVLVMVAVFVFPSLAQASWVDDNFDNNLMNPNLWTTIITEDEEGGAKDQLHFFERNHQLEWETDSEWTDNSDNSRGYGSKWNFILDQDFEVKVDFHYDHTAAFPSDEGGILLAFFDPLVESNYASISAKNHSIHGSLYQVSGLSIPETWWGRTLLSGQLSARYSVLEDKLYLSSSEGYPVVIPDLKSLGINELSVGLIGWSGGAKLSGCDAYFDDFTVTKGHITPEPGTMMLLGSLAAGLFGITGMRRKRR